MFRRCFEGVSKVFKVLWFYGFKGLSFESFAGLVVRNCKVFKP